MRCIFPITQRSGKDRQVREQDACRGRDADQRKASRLLSDGEIEIHREDPDRDYKKPSAVPVERLVTIIEAMTVRSRPEMIGRIHLPMRRNTLICSMHS